MNPSEPVVIEGDGDGSFLCGRNGGDVGVVGLGGRGRAVLRFVVVIVVNGDEARQGNRAEFLIQQVRKSVWGLNHLQ